MSGRVAFELFHCSCSCGYSLFGVGFVGGFLSREEAVYGGTTEGGREGGGNRMKCRYPRGKAKGEERRGDRRGACLFALSAHDPTCTCHVSLSASRSLLTLVESIDFPYYFLGIHIYQKASQKFISYLFEPCV